MGKFSWTKPSNKSGNQPPVSVIIACKNEEDNLKENLPLFINQSYPEFEIILINDSSVDDTWETILEFNKQHNNISGLDLSTTKYSGKKHALNNGIKKAKYEHLIFTDADCKPASSQWLDEISQRFSDKKTIVLGYGKYKTDKGFLNKTIRYETVQTAWQYFSYALNNIPYMGVGRNMAYTKSTFNDNNGFQSHFDKKSGDDDLFINEVAHGNNTAIVWGENAHTISRPKTSWTSWIQQKRRHLSVGGHYQSKHVFLLSGFYVSQVAFWILMLFYFFNFGIEPFGTAIIIIRFIVYYITLVPVLKKLDEEDLLYLAPILELLVIMTQAIVYVSNMIWKPKNW